MPVIDSDAHVIESEKTWSYLAADEKHFAPVILSKTGETPTPDNTYWLSGDHIQTKDNADTLTMDESMREMGSVDARLKHMDELNIDLQVLYPTIFLVPCARDPQQQAGRLWGMDVDAAAGNDRQARHAVAQQPQVQVHRLLERPQIGEPAVQVLLHQLLRAGQPVRVNRQVEGTGAAGNAGAA